MKGSFQIARWFGIPVKVHWSFFLLFIMAGLASQTSDGKMQFLWISAFMLTMFFCVVLHEFGHALTARRYGVSTKDIILTPIGGIARLNKLPEKPLQEFKVAIAGPLVNVVIALLLSPIIFGLLWNDFSDLMNLLEGKPPHGSLYVRKFFLPSVFLVNLVLAGFNMLPAFPMDGGRILRSLLSLRWGRTKATRVASRIGQVISVLLMIYGLWAFDIIPVFIGLFVFFTAAQEYKFVLIDHILESGKVANVMQRQFTRLQEYDSMQIAADLLQKGQEKNFVVYDESGNVAGILIEKSIIQAIQENRLEESVRENVYPGYLDLEADQSLRSAFESMQQKGMRIAPVQETGETIAVLHAHNIHQYIQLQQKIKQKI